MRIRHRDYRLATSLGRDAHYRIDDALGRHFVESGKAAGFGLPLMRTVIDEVSEAPKTAPDRALSKMPEDFHEEASDAVRLILPRRLALLDTTDGML